MKQLLHKLSAATRASDWRLSFVPFIMGCVYMWLWWFEIPFTAASVWLTFLSLITAVGFAALGYLINEFFDKESDAKAGKINKLAYLPHTYQLSIFVAALLLTFLPWIWLPTTAFSWLLIAIQIGLFLVYSLPFPRWKEHIYLSLIIDSGYAYVVPLLLSFYTFSLIAAREGFPLWFYIFMAAVFFIGLRNIIIHQVRDVFKDAQSGMRTLPMVIGVERARYVTFTLWLYETALMILFSIVFALDKVEMMIWLLIVTIISLIRKHEVSVQSETLLNGSFFSNKLYQYAFPMLMLFFTALNDIRWLLALVGFHLIFLFPPEYVLYASSFVLIVWYRVKVVFWNTVSKVRHLISLSVNLPIYWLFRLFGVDLIKEKKSAAEVLFGRRKKA